MIKLHVMVNYFVVVECLYNTRLYLKQDTKSYFAQPSSEKLINRPGIPTPVCNDQAYLCNA